MQLTVFIALVGPTSLVREKTVNFQEMKPTEIHLGLIVLNWSVLAGVEVEFPKQKRVES